MSVVAVAMTTESGDHYLDLYEGVESPSGFVYQVETDMNEELAYVYRVEVRSTSGDFSSGDFKNALLLRILQLQEELDID
ncbi:hypothetical protein psageK4_041c [Pseudomonas phage psageK4]|uniref:Uncharacterized protein n=2 Tax=Otagovirus TaxID=2560197 RepID=A0AAE9BT30_9CAUD|nr:hypothetical protein QGX14_gp041 [Pseudomonas phage psageK4]YP_010766950.1 hypothetical protein QGX15_gp045 [Pseudomonas phage psageK4e]QXV71695.1 hypothetical protein psageK4_041c [Pseudomonas phage psageK4]UAW53493.1 hypothetical protein psageK4e_045c [Pseudomonas phage psageK4e]